MPRQVIEGFEEEFESISKKKANLEAEKKAEIEKIENLFKERETKISKLLELISFEVPEEEVAEEIRVELPAEGETVEKKVNESFQEETGEPTEVESPTSEEVLTSAFGKIRFA